MSDDVDKLKDVAYDNKHRLDTHEQLCALRYEQILEKLKASNEQIIAMNDKIEALTTLATKGQTSLATILWLGGTVAAVTAFIIMILKNMRII